MSGNVSADVKNCYLQIQAHPKRKKNTLAFKKKENRLYKSFICDLKPDVKQSFPLCTELTQPYARNLAHARLRVHLPYLIHYVMCCDRRQCRHGMHLQRRVKNKLIHQFHTQYWYLLEL